MSTLTAVATKIITSEFLSVLAKLFSLMLSINTIQMTIYCQLVCGCGKFTLLIAATSATLKPAPTLHFSCKPIDDKTTPIMIEKTP